jgi:transporter family protein
LPRKWGRGSCPGIAGGESSTFRGGDLIGLVSSVSFIPHRRLNFNQARIIDSRTVTFENYREVEILGAVRTWLDGNGKERHVNWLLWACLSALFAGLTAVLAKAGVKDIDSNLATAIRTTVVLIFAWSIAVVAGSGRALATVPAKGWLFLILSGLATGASWLCYFRALQLGDASRVAPVDKLSVVVAMALAALFLGEHLTWQHWAGGALIVAGTLVIAWG